MIKEQQKNSLERCYIICLFFIRLYLMCTTMLRGSGLACSQQGKLDALHRLSSNMCLFTVKNSTVLKASLRQVERDKKSYAKCHPACSKIQITVERKEYMFLCL